MFPNMSLALPGYKSKKPSKLNRRNFNPFIPLCQYDGQPKLMNFESCNMFNRAYTDSGLGYSFNTKRFFEMYKDTGVNSDKFQAFFFNNETQVRYPRSSGKKFQLKMVIDANSEEVEVFENTMYENQP